MKPHAIVRREDQIRQISGGHNVAPSKTQSAVAWPAAVYSIRSQSRQPLACQTLVSASVCTRKK